MYVSLGDLMLLIPKYPLNLVYTLIKSLQLLLSQPSILPSHPGACAKIR